MALQLVTTVVYAAVPQVYVLVLVLRAVAIIILDGDAANNCVTGLRRTMLEAQTGLLQWVAAHSHGRNHARCTRLREDFILQACTGRCDMSKPNHAHHGATKSRSGGAAPVGDVELKVHPPTHPVPACNASRRLTTVTSDDL